MLDVSGGGALAPAPLGELQSCCESLIVTRLASYRPIFEGPVTLLALGSSN